MCHLTCLVSDRRWPQPALIHGGIHSSPHMLFSHPRTQWGGGCQLQPPKPIRPLFSWDGSVGQRPNKSLGVLSSTVSVSELTSLGQILTSPGRVKLKKSDFENAQFFANSFPTKQDSGSIYAPLCFSLQDASKHVIFLPRKVKLKMWP